MRNKIVMKSHIFVGVKYTKKMQHLIKNNFKIKHFGLKHTNFLSNEYIGQVMDNTVFNMNDLIKTKENINHIIFNLYPKTINIDLTFFIFNMQTIG